MQHREYRSNDSAQTASGPRHAQIAGAILTAHADIEIPFQDLDPMDIAWHGNYFRYFEAARVNLLRVIDYDYPEMKASNYLWPLIDVRARFVSPMRYGQQVRVWAGLVEWDNRMKINYRAVDAQTGERLTTGYSVQCAIDASTWELQLVSPPALLNRLKAYL